MSFIKSRQGFFVSGTGTLSLFEDSGIIFGIAGNDGSIISGNYSTGLNLGTFAGGVVTGEGSASLIGSIISDKQGSISFGKVRDGSIRSGKGCIAQGYNHHGNIYNTEAKGSFVQGYTGSTIGNIYCKNNGTFAQGYAASSRKIQVTGTGSFAQGYAKSSNIINSANGSFVQGNAISLLSNTGKGSFVQGNAEGGNLFSAGTGNFLQGCAYGTIRSTSTSMNGCFVQGYAGAGSMLYNNIKGSFLQGYSLGTGSQISGWGIAGSFSQGFGKNGGSIVQRAKGGFAQGHALKNTITTSVQNRISSIGCFSQGYAMDGYVLSRSSGNFSQGYAKNGRIVCYSNGSFAQGCISGTSSGSFISSGSAACFTQGEVVSPGFIKSESSAIFAQGSIGTAGKMLVQGPGSFVQGRSLSTYFLVSSAAQGSFLHCYGKGTGNVSITQDGGFFHGYIANTMSATVGGKGAAIFCSGISSANNATNYLDNSLQVGPDVNSIRLIGNGIPPVYPSDRRNGDFWVANNRLYVKSNGVNIDLSVI